MTHALRFLKPFQSAPPAREATPTQPLFSASRQFQSAPPAREATTVGNVLLRREEVSIRAPRAGGDDHGPSARLPNTGFQSAPPAREATIDLSPLAVKLVFQSAPPAREATAAFRVDIRVGGVSIRAPRAGGDDCSRLPPPSRPGFQSAPPAREATRAASASTS